MDILPNIVKHKLDAWFFRLNDKIQTGCLNKMVQACNSFYSKIPDDAIIVEISDQFHYNFKGNLKLELLDCNKTGVDSLLTSLGR